MEVIGLGCPPIRKSGIPVRLPPKNICDVNPWVCRMTPADFSSMQSREPAVAQMTFEPQPRGCNCCVERLVHPKSSDSDEVKEEYKPKNKSNGGKENDSKKRKKRTKKVDPAKKKKQQQQEYERVRLLREKKRRHDFVTACCQGLMMTPCGSVESCSDLNEQKEQANFFIHADCSPNVNKREKAEPCKQDAVTKKQRADFPCQCKTCKYVKHRTDARTGCRQTITDEKTVCYCTEEEKCETSAEPKPMDCSPCGARPVNSPQCQDTVKCIDDWGQQAGGVLFTAALTQEMLIQQARNSVDIANCIPTNTQYCVQCQRLPRAPILPCQQPVTESNKTVVECKKVADITCPPDMKCSVYNCQQNQLTRVKCTTMPDCSKIYDLDCTPDVTYQLNDSNTPCSTVQQYQQHVCREPCQQPPSSQINCNLSTCPCRMDSNQGSCRLYGGSRETKPCGHICIPKGAVPINGNTSKSKLLIPLTFHPQVQSNNSAGYPCMDRSRQRPAQHERMNSVRENFRRYSSPRKTSDPIVQSRFSQEKTIDSRNLVRSSDTQFTKNSSQKISPRNSFGFYGVSAEGAIDQPPIGYSKPAEYGMKTKLDRGYEEATKPVHNARKQSEPKMRERPRSRSPSPAEMKTKVPRKTKEIVRKVSDKGRSTWRPSSPPHFEDVEPGRTASLVGKSGYEAALVEAMEKVKRRYLEQNHDTTGSSSARSRATSTPCVTPTYQEFMCLTEQIKCLRRELRKYCSANIAQENAL